MRQFKFVFSRLLCRQMSARQIGQPVSIATNSVYASGIDTSMAAWNRCDPAHSLTPFRGWMRQADLTAAVVCRCWRRWRRTPLRATKCRLRYLRSSLCVVARCTAPVCTDWRSESHCSAQQLTAFLCRIRQFCMAVVNVLQELIIEMRNPNVTWRIIWHVYLFTTELRHTCSSLLFLSK